ncbi:anti-adapter protein IraP [Mangrovibacter plantisponsor]|uniref:Sigma-S stabilization anti-adaptor protein n=1 Tax=Mangrovibacter plantisponsor TaxID=451513 RepID=A0A317PLA2_9ENTR|nr:anti-adapter protein IraP [Mangrovibacter plantisponsor]PWW01273.1 sigma-S stabilization anti-adaptor protein [Mangrovibacter plantisponsor]
MKNLIADLLITLAEKEDATRELVAQVEALEVVVTALLKGMGEQQRQSLIGNIETALDDLRPGDDVPDPNIDLLSQNIKKILHY